MASRPLTHPRAFFLALTALALSAIALPLRAADIDVGALKRRASVELAARQYAAAVQTLQGVVKAAPRDDQGFVMLGDAQRGLGDFANAVKSYEQAIRINYGGYRQHLKLGTLLMENGKTGRALTEFEIAMKYGDTDPLVHYNYGLALHDLGRTREALPHWRAARDLQPDNADYVAAVGIGLSDVDNEGAIEAFRRAEELGKRDANFCNHYALALERAGDRAGARKYFEAAVAAGGARENEYRRNLARHDLRVGNNAEAARALEILVAKDGGKWSDTVYLGRAYLAEGRFDDAIAALEAFASDVESGKIERTHARIDRMPPSVGEALSVVGMAWRGKGDLERSRDYLRRAAARAGDDPSVLINYGVVLAESGMLPDAKAQWRRVLEIDPGNATAKANLSAFGQ